MSTTPIWVTLLATVISGLAGIILGRFSMTKKERADVDQKNYENAVAANALHIEAYKAYTAALTAYCASSNPTLDQFSKVATTGDAYFTQIGRMCDAILAQRVDPGLRDITWLPKIKRAFETLLPRHYETLIAQAAKRGFDYQGKLRRSDHDSIYSVAERYSGTDAWRRPHEND